MAVSIKDFATPVKVPEQGNPMLGVAEFKYEFIGIALRAIHRT